MGLALAGTTVGAAAPAPTFSPVERTSLALHGRTLVIGESGPVRLPTFTYHRARISSVRLTANRLGFASRPARRMVIRTSIGPFAPALLAVNARGEMLAAASGRGFAGPVVWCCDAGEERVLYADGRSGAARPLSVAFRDGVARALVGSGARVGLIERGADGAVAREDFTVPAAAPYALGPTTMSSVHAPREATVLTDPVRTGAGPIALPARRFAGRAPAGRVTRVWMDGDVPISLIRRGRVWEIFRHRAPRRRTLLLRTRVRPRAVAVGRGAVAVAVGRTIWTGRGATRLRRGPRAGGPVGALAVDRVRVAWVESRGRGARAVQRVRLAGVR